jgi:hypothetical protein
MDDQEQFPNQENIGVPAEPLIGDRLTQEEFYGRPLNDGRTGGRIAVAAQIAISTELLVGLAFPHLDYESGIAVMGGTFILAYRGLIRAARRARARGTGRFYG